jgi:DNA-binding CsgD family transcriptional regulator/PAS domain-containing protein
MSDLSGIAEATVLNLVSLIYAAAEDPTRWHDFLHAWNEAVYGTGGSLLIQHDIAGEGSVSASEDVDFSERFDVCQLAAVPSTKDDRSAFSRSPWRRQRDEAFRETEMALLDVLMPHLKRAFQIHGALNGAAASRDAALAAVDHVPMAIVGVDATARVVLANRAAEALLASGGDVHVRNGMLEARTPKETGTLRQAISEATSVIARNTVDASKGTVLVVRANGRPALHIRVTAVSAESTFLIGSAPIAALIFIRDPEDFPSIDTEKLMVLFGMTPSEARFAEALAQGLTTQEIAKKLRLRRATARWMLERVREKTAASTQSEAVSRILNSLATFMSRG